MLALSGMISVVRVHRGLSSLNAEPKLNSWALLAWLPLDVFLMVQAPTLRIDIIVCRYQQIISTAFIRRPTLNWF